MQRRCKTKPFCHLEQGKGNAYCTQKFSAAPSVGVVFFSLGRVSIHQLLYLEVVG
jgi:hypothetical protein